MKEEDKELFKGIVDRLRSEYKPQTKSLEAMYFLDDMNSGVVNDTMYFDEYRCEWTTEDRAFQGYVLKHITPLIT